MSTSNGFFINYLYYKKENLLILAYGISETNDFEGSWNSQIYSKYYGLVKISNMIKNPKRYGDSLIFKYYKPLIEDDKVKYFIEEKTSQGYSIDKPVTYDSMQKDLDLIIHQYKQCLSEWSAKGRPGLKPKNVAPERSNLLSKLKSDLKKGESKTVEFKETFHLNTYTKNKDSKLEHAVIKTIAGFLNTEGGTLYIGVNDDGRVIGINEELSKFHKDSADNYHKHIANILNKSFENYDLIDEYIERKIIHHEGIPILKIECQKSSKPIFVIGFETKPTTYFYIRQHPLTKQLTGSLMLEYIASNFSIS